MLRAQCLVDHHIECQPVLPPHRVPDETMAPRWKSLLGGILPDENCCSQDSMVPAQESGLSPYSKAPRSRLGAVKATELACLVNG